MARACDNNATLVLPAPSLLPVHEWSAFMAPILCEHNIQHLMHALYFSSCFRWGEKNLPSSKSVCLIMVCAIIFKEKEN
jgi:hypothetical protein